MSTQINPEIEKPPSKDDEPFQWTLSNIIRLLREFTLLVVLAYLGFSLISGNIGISFGTKVLTASEIISIMLAFFAILLSAAFYYMSTKQSSDFYHNVHQFTKQTSEILGRLDEQVKGIGGRQTELKDTFEKNYAYSIENKNSFIRMNNEKLQTEIEKKEAELKAEQTSIQETINSLIERVSFTSIEEKEKLISTLDERTKEIEKLRSDVEKKANARHLTPYVKRYTASLIRNKYMDEIYSLDALQLFRKIIAQGPEGYKEDLVSLDFIHINEFEEINITREGVKFISEIILEIDKR